MSVGRLFYYCTSHMIEAHPHSPDEADQRSVDEYLTRAFFLLWFCWCKHEDSHEGCEDEVACVTFVSLSRWPSYFMGYCSTFSSQHFIRAVVQHNCLKRWCPSADQYCFVMCPFGSWKKNVLQYLKVLTIIQTGSWETSAAVNKKTQINLCRGSKWWSVTATEQHTQDTRGCKWLESSSN